MSIASEIKRLKDAKQDIKDAIEKRGVAVSESLKIDSFAAVINSAPYGIRGTFTPEEDTQVFSISGLPFSPESVYVVCNELYNSGIVDAICLFVHSKDKRGMALSWGETARLFSALSEGSKLSVYKDDGYEFDVSESQGMSTNVFKAGYSYDYYISGGFAQ